MPLMSIFFISNGKSPHALRPEAVGEVQDKYALASITPLEAAAIYAALLGADDPVPLAESFELLTPEDAAEWTFRVPGGMTEALVRLSASKLAAVAERCAELTAAELGASAADLEEVLGGLLRLAKRAVASGQSLYLWNGL